MQGKPISRETILVVALFALLAVAILVFSPSVNKSEDAKDSVRYNIVVNDVSNLAGAQVDLKYNPAVLSFTRVTEGTFLDNGKDEATLLETTKNTPGGVDNIVVLRLTPGGVQGSGVLATVEFTTLTDGDAQVQLADVLLSDSNGNAVSTQNVRLEKQ
jgi:trimeric autotransporter adhesin